MANPNPIFLKVRLHYNDVFTRHPYRYTGGDTFMFTDHDFSGMDLHGCCEFLEWFVGEPFEKLYYLAHDQTMANGLTFDEESDESGSVIQEDDKEPSQGIHDPELAYMFDVGLEDEINGEYWTPLNKTKDNEFLNKLCPEGGEEKNVETQMDNIEELDNNVLKEHLIFNPQAQKVEKRIAEVASGNGTRMEGGDTHGENVKKRTAEVGNGSWTRMEGGDSQCTKESGTTQVTRERGNVVLPHVKRRKRSEMIIKKKLTTQIIGKNGEGNTLEKPVNLM
ncbi:unnamed protein product [Lactuca saligna]|uniref:Uncharacterized protein n=1 Tax=Lactuca saligna TaxID=75948 RepID=A0AA36A0F0_LACSI|nr:unnamed protein product [Lactuca saligna]